MRQLGFDLSRRAVRRKRRGGKTSYQGVRVIPDGSPTFHFEQSSGGNPAIVVPFPINLEFGTAGFRNFGPESAFVRNFRIETV